MNTTWEDLRSRREIMKRDRQAAKLGSLIDASYKLAERLRIASTTYDLYVGDRIRAASKNVQDATYALELARDKFSGSRRA